MRVFALSLASALGVITTLPARAQTYPAVLERPRPDPRLARSVWLADTQALTASLVRSAPPNVVAGPVSTLPQRAFCECATHPFSQLAVAAGRIVQEVPVLELVGSFLLPSNARWARVSATAGLGTTPELRIVPARFAGGYGLTAIGRF